jgi:hypothetical protein
MPGSVQTRPSQLSVHSILRAKALPSISGYLSIKSTHDCIFYLRRCEILSGLLWRSVDGVYKKALHHRQQPSQTWYRTYQLLEMISRHIFFACKQHRIRQYYLYEGGQNIVDRLPTLRLLRWV